MTPEQAAHESSEAISQFASAFMLDGATYGRGAELGFPGMTFYVGGRGGVLGPVHPDVVAAAMVFFNPQTVRDAWEVSVKVMDPHEAAVAFAECGHTWAQRLPDDLDVDRLADLAGRIEAGASPAGAPLFAGWRAMAEPDEPKARALHRMNVLRELQGNLHAAAVLAAGLEPLEAMSVRSPHMTKIFGWDDNLPNPEQYQDRWEVAERSTAAMLAPAFAALDEDERAEFVILAHAAHAAMPA
jgi:hypothetical protein